MRYGAHDNDRFDGALRMSDVMAHTITMGAYGIHNSGRCDGTHNRCILDNNEINLGFFEIFVTIIISGFHFSNLIDLFTQCYYNLGVI